MNVTLWRCAFATIVLTAFGARTSLPAQSFRIAHTSDGFTVFRFAAISDSGEVVFSASRIVGGIDVVGVYKASGSGFRPIIEGSVTLNGVINGQEFPDGPVTAVGPVAINSAGNLAVDLQWDQINGSSIDVAYVGRDSVTPDIYLNDQNVFPLFVVPAVSAGAPLTLNDQGSVALAPYLTLPTSNPKADLRQTRIVGYGLDNQNQQVTYSGGLGGVITLVGFGYVKRFPTGDIVDLKTVSTNVVGSVPSDIQPSAFELNANGMVAYRGDRADGSGGIYRGSGGAVIAYPAPGSVAAQSAEFLDPSLFAINNSGEVAFYSHSRSLGNYGFFRGVNPFTDKIVAVGDIVAGNQVSNLRLPALNAGNPGHWFNTAGQVVFLADDATGTGLYVASSGITPVPPEPASTTIEWQGPGDPPPGTAPSGTFAQTNAWKPLNGDPPRVPQRTQTLNDTALFDRPEAYSVDLGATQHAGRMLVVDGNVTFTNGSIQLDEESDTTPSVVIDNARLTLNYDPVFLNVGPTVSGQFGLIGQNAAARVDVVANAGWELNRVLTIGGPGEGILTVDSGGVVTTGGALVGGAGGGHVNIGDRGSWTTGNLAVGAGGQGDLTIQDGGHVDSDAGFIGLSGSPGNKVLLQGGNGNDVSRWDVAYLAVGGGGDGELDIMDGAFVNSALAIIAQLAGGDGSVTVSGVDTNGQPSTLSALILLAGQKGNAELNVLDGAKVVSGGNIFLSEFHGSSVSAKVSGINVAQKIPSTLHADGVLVVGDVAPASLVIDSAGKVESQRGIVEDIVPQSFSEVKIIGSASSWIIQDDLTVGYDSDGNLGQAIVSLVDGYLKAGSIEVDKGGLVLGFGTLAVDPTNRVVNAGGTISPGFSPGTISINGSFQQLAGGRLLMDIGGTNYADNDHLIITNSAILDGNITFRFLNGFAPKQGQQFDFLSVGGTLTGNFATVGVENLAPGFQFGLVTNGPALSLVASNDAVFSVTLPGQLDATVTNIAGIIYAVCLLTTSNSCQSITADGPLVRTNNAFTQSFQGATLVVGNCLDQVQTITNIQVLGALPAGDYTFNIISGGQSVSLVPFNVAAAGPGQALMTPNLQADGSVQFQILGLPPVRYTVQVSTDLKDWRDIATGVLPDTFTDPDTTLYPQRFYRAIIGP